MERAQYPLPKREPYTAWTIACDRTVAFEQFEDPEEAIANFPDCADVQRDEEAISVCYPFRLIRIDLPKPPPPLTQFGHELAGIKHSTKTQIALICRDAERALHDDMRAIISDLFPKQRRPKRRRK